MLTDTYRFLIVLVGTAGLAALTGCGASAAGDGETGLDPLQLQGPGGAGEDVGGEDPNDADEDGEGAGDPRASERIVIRFSSGEFELVSRIPVRKLLPPSTELPDTQEPISGFWFELQSEEGEVIYRRFTGNPVPLAFEGPESSTEGTVPDRVEVIPEERVFTLLIPAPVEGDKLVLFSSPLELDAQASPASEVASFTFQPVVR